MKKLYIIRHAKSSWSDETLRDFERPLSKRGKANAPMMGGRLKEKGVMPDIILSSPAKRAKSTAKMIAKEVGCEKKVLFDENIYESSVDELYKILTELDDKNSTVFLVGHNPSLNELSRELVGFDANIPTCGIVEIEFKSKKWAKISAKNARLLSFDYPKNSDGQFMNSASLAKKFLELKEFINNFVKNSLQSADDVHALRIKCRELFSLLDRDDAVAKSIKKAISLSNGIRDMDVFFDDYLESLPKKYRKKVQEQISAKTKEGGRKKEIKKLRSYLKNLELPNSAEQKSEEESAQKLIAIKFPEFDKKKLHKYRIYVKKRLYIEKNALLRDEKKIKILTNIKDALGAINDNFNGLKRLRDYGVKDSLCEKIEKFTQEENRKLYEKARGLDCEKN